MPKRTVIENGSAKPNGIAKTHGGMGDGSVQLELPMSSTPKSPEDERLVERARAIVDSLDKLTSEEVFAAFEELDQMPTEVVRAALEDATGPAPDPELLDDAIRRAHGFPARPLRLRRIRVTKDADVFDLGPVAEQQLRLAGKAWDGRDLEPEERLDGELEDSFAGTLEHHVLADADQPGAPPLFDVLRYAGDAGTIFRAGTAEIVGAIAYGIVEVQDRRLRVAIQEALARPVVEAELSELQAIEPMFAERFEPARVVDIDVVAPSSEVEDVRARASSDAAPPSSSVPASADVASESTPVVETPAISKKKAAAKKSVAAAKKVAAASTSASASSKRAAASSKKEPAAAKRPSAKGAAKREGTAERTASKRGGAAEPSAKKASAKKAAAQNVAAKRPSAKTASPKKSGAKSGATKAATKPDAKKASAKSTSKKSSGPAAKKSSAKTSTKASGSKSGSKASAKKKSVDG